MVKCKNCGREKEWYESPLCSECGHDETQDDLVCKKIKEKGGI